MNCCNKPSCANGVGANSIGDFFSKEARNFLKRSKRRGLEKSQKNLVEGLSKAGISDKSILEIGCGVGYLHSRLLLGGARSAFGVDISEEMLRLAKMYMKELGLEDKTDYLQGDFAEISEAVKPSDILILDKVICCYPEVENLVEKSIAKTKSIYAFTLPRDAWWVKSGMTVVIRFLKLFGSKFHPYFHDHAIVNGRLANNGFTQIYHNQTLAWETYVFQK